MYDATNIEIKGARINNLKNIDVTIPRDKLIVITGLSGSGKSSLAFDTLYAEGQRRYVESLSAYARQFLGRMGKPECDYIKGIPPAIAIEQRVNTRNPRSTVGTSTEIYEYLRLLYARIGKTISPVSGEEVKKHQVSDVVNWVLDFPENTRFSVYTPVVLPEGRDMKEQLTILQKEGYTRLEIDENVYRIPEVMENESLLASGGIQLLIDRLAVAFDKPFKNRLADSVETAFFEGHGTCVVKIFDPNGTQTKEFSRKFEADGIVFEEPTDMMFSFNNPLGACPVCEGFGKIMGIDEGLVVPDKSKSLYDGAVVCWKGEKMGEWLNAFIQASAKYDFPIHRPYYELTENDVILTVLTDSMEMYTSRLEEMRTELGAYSPLRATVDHQRFVLGMGTDGMMELNYYDRKRIHNLKYYTWVEQQGKTSEELNAQWYDPDYWKSVHRMADLIDEKIDEFNKMTGLGE